MGFVVVLFCLFFLELFLRFCLFYVYGCLFECMFVHHMRTVAPEVRRDDGSLERQSQEGSEKLWMLGIEPQVRWKEQSAFLATVTSPQHL